MAIATNFIHVTAQSYNLICIGIGLTHTVWGGGLPFELGGDKIRILDYEEEKVVTAKETSFVCLGAVN